MSIWIKWQTHVQGSNNPLPKHVEEKTLARGKIDDYYKDEYDEGEDLVGSYEEMDEKGIGMMD